MMIFKLIAPCMLFLALTHPAHANCFNVDVRREGSACRAYVTNHCGRPLQCFVSVVGFSAAGRSLRETGTVNLGVGHRGSYGIGPVAACGNANAECRLLR